MEDVDENLEPELDPVEEVDESLLSEVNLVEEVDVCREPELAPLARLELEIPAEKREPEALNC